MAEELVNRNATPGHNLAPPYAQEVTERLARDFEEIVRGAESLVADATLLPATVETQEDSQSVAAYVVKLRDMYKRLKAHHDNEKEPYLRGGEAVDSFFFERMDSCKNTGAQLNMRVDNYNQRLLAAARRKQAEELAERQAQAEAARRAQEAAEQAVRDAEAAAARARKPEVIEQRKEEAAKARENADLARVDTMIANEGQVQAYHETLQPASRIVGQRFTAEGIGGQIGTRIKPVVSIEDSTLLDKNALWPFIKEDEKLRALKAWAKTTNHRTKMEGAIITTVDGTVIR